MGAADGCVDFAHTQRLHRRENTVKPATPSSRSAGVAGGYRQIRSIRIDQDAVQETFRVYDIVHEAADHRVNQLFRYLHNVIAAH